MYVCNNGLLKVDEGRVTTWESEIYYGSQGNDVSLVFLRSLLSSETHLQPGRESREAPVSDNPVGVEYFSSNYSLRSPREVVIHFVTRIK